MLERINRIPEHKRKWGLIVACLILAATSFTINSPEKIKKDPNANEKRLVASIEFAKRTAGRTGTLAADEEITFTHLQKYLRRDGKPATISQIANGKHNGTGKNITSWGTIPSKYGPALPPTLSYARPPVTK